MVSTQSGLRAGLRWLSRAAWLLHDCLQLSSKLSPLLSQASTVLYDNGMPAQQQSTCPLSQLAAYRDAAAKQRVQPLRTLMHKLRCARGMVAAGRCMVVSKTTVRCCILCSMHQADS
jgi:hypothetical protein